LQGKEKAPQIPQVKPLKPKGEKEWLNYLGL
jgi:hypothetical protein